MPSSTFEHIKARNDWTSYGAVTFPDLVVTKTSKGEVLRAGYYPCAGVVFTPTAVTVKSVPVKPAPWYIDGQGAGTTQPKPVARDLRTMQFTVTNPPQAYVDKVRAALDQDPESPENFPPQVLMDADFVDLYQKLTFTEYGNDLLLSDIMFLPEVKLYDRNGKVVGRDGPHTVVFAVTHHVNTETGKVGMVQRAIWDNGKYRATYGCC